MSLLRDIAILDDISDQDCICTKEQQSGGDYTMCKSCTAGNAYNRICEIVRDELRELKNLNETKD